MTVNLTHPRPDARLDSSRTGNTPAARREEQTAAPAAHAPAPGPAHDRRRATEAEGSQGAAPARRCIPRFDTAGATRARRVTFRYRFPLPGDR